MFSLGGIFLQWCAANKIQTQTLQGLVSSKQIDELTVDSYFVAALLSFSGSVSFPCPQAGGKEPLMNSFCQEEEHTWEECEGACRV